MDLVESKTAQTAAMGFVVGASFSLWHALRTAGAQVPALPFSSMLAEAAREGARTSAILGAATAAAGVVSFAQHGRYSPRLLQLRGEPATVFSAVFVGSLVATYVSAGDSAAAAVAAGVTSVTGATGAAARATASAAAKSASSAATSMLSSGASVAGGGGGSLAKNVGSALLTAAVCGVAAGMMK